MIEARRIEPGTAMPQASVRRFELLRALDTPRLWITLAWHDVVQSYRRTVFGPFWITLNMVIFALAMTLVYAALFGIPAEDYSGYIVCSMMVWWWIMAVLNESANALMNHTGLIRSLPCDKSVFVWSSAFKQVIVFCHSALVYLALVVLGLIEPSVYTLLALPALALIFVLSIPLIAMLSILYVRYRDLQRLIGSASIILMMITPVFWKPDMMKGWRTIIYEYNPLYYLLELVRAPLLGQPIQLHVLLVVVAMALISWLVGLAFFQRYQRYLVFWL